ncbi:MAG: PH domain-containing protein [Chloroflexota bacterium]
MPVAEPVAEALLWEGQPHGVLNPIEAHAVHYELTSERLRTVKGLLSRTVDEVELTRVRDVTVEQSLAQRALGIGNVSVVTTDATSPRVLLHDVAEPEQVKELIRQAVREQRQRLRVRQHEDL